MQNYVLVPLINWTALQKRDYCINDINTRLVFQMHFVYGLSILMNNIDIIKNIKWHEIEATTNEQWRIYTPASILVKTREKLDLEVHLA